MPPFAEIAKKYIQKSVLELKSDFAGHKMQANYSKINCVSLYISNEWLKVDFFSKSSTYNISTKTWNIYMKSDEMYAGFWWQKLLTIDESNQNKY